MVLPTLVKRSCLLLLFAIAVSLPAWAAPPKEVIYTVSVADTTAKKYRVTARAEGVSDSTVSFAIPAWSPGWYVLTNAYKNITNVSATSDSGKMLTVSHPDKLTWTVSTEGASSVTLTYDLSAIDQDPDVVGPEGKSFIDYGFFAPYLDDKNGFVPGPAALVYVVDGKEAPCRISYKVPSGWNIASGNDPTSDPTTFTAPNYDTLADQPAELGKFERFDKTINGVPFSVVLVNAPEDGKRKFVENCWKISEAGLKVFGKAPFPRYLYIFHAIEDFPAIMGLEHLNSTIICLPTQALEENDLGALGVVAHEYVHAWVVKRIRSETLGPFDYTKEVRTKDLWFFEGVTDYYAPRLIVVAGIAGDDFWRGYMAEQIRELQGNPARLNVSLETASLKAWEGRSEGFGGLSYYNKGLVVGLLLDVEMRRLTQNRVGLDDIIKELMKQTLQTGKGFTEGEIERVANRLTGKNLTTLFDTALRSTKELDFEAILPSAGLEISQFRFTRADLGLDLNSLSLVGESIKVGEIVPDGAAQKAGLQKGDIIESIDGKPALKAIGPLLQFRRPGSEVELVIKRDKQSQKVLLTLGQFEESGYDLSLARSLTTEQRAIYRAISGSGKSTATTSSTPGRD